MTSITDDLACQEFVELVTEYLEGDLPPSQASRLEVHLDACPDCRRFLDQMRLAIGALRVRGDGTFSPAMRDELVKRFRQSRERQSR